MPDRRVRLDHAATEPLREEALEAMLPFLRGSANPAATYASGREARRELEKARARIAACIGAEPSEVYFTSGGTESDNWALRALATKEKGHIVTSQAEHHAVLDTCDALEAEGFRVSRVRVDACGRPLLDEVREALAEDTCLLSLMLANNELGSLTDLEGASGLATGRGIPLHTDAVSACGHVPVRVDAPRVDLMSLSAHKLGGPVGVGALYVRRGLRPAKLMRGGSQERNLRAGTQNVAGAVGFAAAFEASMREMDQEVRRVSVLRDLLRDRLSAIPGLRLTSPEGGACLPGIVHFLLPGVLSEAALVYLDKTGFECAAGSACTSGAAGPSHVLLAAGFSSNEARCAVRVSLGGDTSATDLEEFSQAVSDLCGRAARLRPCSFFGPSRL